MRKINAFCIKRKKLIIRNPPKINKKSTKNKKERQYFRNTSL
jgi:hypothetical protein